MSLLKVTSLSTLWTFPSAKSYFLLGDTSSLTIYVYLVNVERNVYIYLEDMRRSCESILMV